MSWLRYLISVDSQMITFNLDVALSGSGIYWYMCAGGGNKSYLHHHAVSVSKSSAQMELLSGVILVSGRPFLSLYNMALKV